MGGIILLCDCLLIFCGNFSRFMWIGVLVLCSMKLILLIMVFEEKLVVVDLYFENVI